MRPDLDHPLLSTRDRQMLKELVSQRTEYRKRDNTPASAAMAKAIQIVWNSFGLEPWEPPDTQAAELDLNLGD